MSLLSNKYNIRLLTLSDVELLHSLSVTTFSESFGHLNTKSNMDEYLYDKLNVLTLKSELLNPNSKFYIIESLGNTCGYLKLNTSEAQTIQKLPFSLEIERIYVHSLYQGHGIGQILLDKAIDEAKKNDKTEIWLGVWDQNTGAIRFYQRHGFEIIDQHEFLLGQDRQTDLILKLNVCNK